MKMKIKDSKPSSDEGNSGCSTTSNSDTSRASTGTTTVSYPSISVSSHGQSSLEEASNVEVPFHELSVQDVTRQGVEPNPSHVEEDELIEGDSSIDWDKAPNYDSYPSEDDQSEVTASLRNEGLKSPNLIVAIDFTVSNEWTGKVSFSNQSLHALGGTPNPYEQAISIIGKTLARLDEDNLIPCFGFGDGPTSYAPVVEAAIDIVEKSGGQYHVLLIISNGQVTRSVNTSDEELRRHKNESIKSIVNASSYPLSIVLVGVGDGPWEDMKKFADKLPARKFDNFQFVNFTEIMSKNATPLWEETDFPLAALMELPLRHKAAIELGILGRVTGRAQKIIPLPPPVPYTKWEPINFSSVMTCRICETNMKDTAFGCGHVVSCPDNLPRLCVKSVQLSHVPQANHKPSKGVPLVTMCTRIFLHGQMSRINCLLVLGLLCL